MGLGFLSGGSGRGAVTLTTNPGGGLWLPRPISGIGAPSMNQETITTTTGKFAYLFRIPVSGTVSKLAFYVNSVTTSATLDARLETVDLATGAPSGSLYAAGANANFTPTVGWTTVTLGTPAVVTAGDLVAVLIGATGAATSVGFGDISTSDSNEQYPLPMRWAPSVWSKRSERPNCALEYNDGSYAAIAGVYAVSAVTNTAINTGTTPDEYALKFQLPFKARVSGFWVYLDGDGDFDVRLIATDGTTVLKTVSFDKDVRFNGAAGLYSSLFPSGQALSLNTDYYLSILPTTATSITLARFTYPSAAVMAAAEGGVNFREATRADAGAWTENSLIRPLAGLIFDQFGK